MSQAFYSHARLYDLMFPGGGPAVDFYRADANRQGGRVLELGCGTGHKLIPIASDGHPCVGLDLSSDMLAEAQRKANERGVAVEWMQGDMRAFDLGRTFDFVFITANSLLHLHEAEDLVSCGRFEDTWLLEHGSCSMYSTRACAYLPKPMACGAPGSRCRTWTLTVATSASMSLRSTMRPRKLHVGRGTSRPTPSPTSSSHHSKSGASSRRSCHCSSRSAAFGSSSASATGPVDHLPWIRRFNSASASPRD